MRGSVRRDEGTDDVASARAYLWLAYGWVRRQLQRECASWWYSAALTGVVCPDHLRDNQRLGLGLFSLNPLSIRFGGWHMSYFMSIDKIVEKLESISHIER